MSLRSLYVPVAIGAALLSGLYYLIKLRQECGPAPLISCLRQAVTVNPSENVSNPAVEEARKAAERYQRERENAERRAWAADEIRRAAEAKRAADEARRLADEKERAAEDMRKAAIRPPELPRSSATTMVWQVKSMHQHRVQIAFYARERNHEWPGSGQAWDLNDYNNHTYTLNCRTGEKICFGAWVTGNITKFWGVGFGGKQGCSTCCFICGEQPRPQVLHP